MRRAAFVLAFAASGCSDVVTSPDIVSAFGNAPVVLSSPRLDLPDGVAAAVSVGGVAAYDVEAVDERTIRFTPQGHFVGGAHDVVVAVDGAAPVTLADALSIEAPTDAPLARVVALGASITMGTKSMTVDLDSQLWSPAAQLARAAGAYLPMPLIQRGAFPSVTLADYDAATCARVNPNGPPIGALFDAFHDEESGHYWLGEVRVDPDVTPWNVAIGGARVHELLDGYDGQTNLLALVATDPYLTIEEVPGQHATTQADQVEAIAPTLIVSYDLLMNDFSYALHEGVDPTLMPSDVDMEARLRELFARLRATGAEVFVADMPPLALVPDLLHLVEDRIAAGEDRVDVTARFDAIARRVPGMNDALTAAAAAHDVHVVGLNAATQRILDDGFLQVGAERLGLGPLQGLVSLDGLHLTRTADAHVANLMIDAVDAALGLSIPRIDLATVMADDPLAPPALRAAGFDCSAQ